MTRGSQVRKGLCAERFIHVEGTVITGMPRFIVLLVLHLCCVFLQMEDKTLHQQEDHYLLYCSGLESNSQYL